MFKNLITSNLTMVIRRITLLNVTIQKKCAEYVIYD